MHDLHGKKVINVKNEKDGTTPKDHIGVEVDVITDWWHSWDPEGPAKGACELSGQINVQLASGAYQFNWEKLNIDWKEPTIRLFDPHESRVIGPYRKPADKDKEGSWLIAYCVNCLAVEENRERNKVEVAYQDRGQGYAFDMLKRKASMLCVVELDDSELASLTEFCVAHGKKL